MITISCIFTILIILMILLSKKRMEGKFFCLLVFSWILTSNQITSSAIMIGSQELSCDDLTLAACFFMSIFLLLGKRISNKNDKILLFLSTICCFSICVGIIINILFPPDALIVTPNHTWDSYYFGLVAEDKSSISMRSVLVFVRLGIFLIIMIAIIAVMDKKALIRAARITISFSKIHICIGIVEFIVKNLTRSNIVTSVAQFFFPSFGSAYTEILARGNLYALQGFTREPSHFAIAMFIFIVTVLLLIKAGHGKKNDFLWIGIAAFVMMASQAFSSVLYLGILVIFIYVFAIPFTGRQQNECKGLVSFNIRLVFVISLIVACFCVLMSLSDFLTGNYYLERLQNILVNIESLLNKDYANLLGDAQGIPRMISIIESLNAFIERPLFGIGIGTVNPFSGIVSIMACCGIIGLLLWLNILGQYSDAVSGKGSAKYLIILVILSSCLTMDTGAFYFMPWLLIGGIITPEYRRYFGLKL